MAIAKLVKFLLGYNMKIVIYYGESEVNLETEGSIWKMLKLFQYKKVKKGTPNLTSSRAYLQLF